MRIGCRADATIKLSSVKELFSKPMSHGARDTLYGMIDWGCTKLNLFNQQPNQLMVEFSERWNQLRFEEAEQIFNTEQYVKIITGTIGDKKNPGLKVKTRDEVIHAMSLDLLFNDEWSHTNPISRRNRIGDITQYAELYQWAITNFVLGDFPNIDLGKLADMGRLSTLEVIKREASQIVDPDKRSIAYLYAIIRGVSSRDEAITRQAAIASSKNAVRLAQIFDLAQTSSNKIPFKSTSSVDQWAIDREFLDTLRDFDSDLDS